MQSSPLMYRAYFLAACIIEDVRLMSLDDNNLTNENINSLIRGYRVSPSDVLQQQLIEIHMGLIRETIASLPVSLINQKNIGERRSSDRTDKNERRVSSRRVGERRSSDRELLEAGKQGLKKALIQFNLDTAPNFSEFARSHIQQHLENFLQLS